MAPKRQKRAAVVNLSEAESDHDEPRTRSKRVAKKRQTKKAAPTQEAVAAPSDEAAEAPADGPSGSAPSQRTKKEAEPPKERRVDEHGATVTFRPTASQDVKARIKRAMPGSAHRMFLVSTKQLAASGTPDGPSQEFDVLGATGNVYAVRISRQPHCSCPDFAKGHLCKHILFVMLRVLRQSPDNPTIWQRALLTSEVEGVLSRLTGGAEAEAGALDQSVLASERVRQRYAALTSTDNQNEGEALFGNGRQRPVEGECPICYDDLLPEGAAAGGSRAAAGGGEAIVFCRSCGNNMHKDCFDRWASSKRNNGQEVTCVYCRSPWQEERAGAGAGEGEGEYVNLSQYSDAHRGRGPSLGELYGRNAYFIMANQGTMSRRTAARLHGLQGW